MLTAESRPQLTAQQAVAIAQAFIADHLPDLLGGGKPWRMRSPLGSVWVVPVWIVYPGASRQATVGSIAVDEITGHIVSWTPVDEALANVERFHAEEQEAIELDFQVLRANIHTEELDALYEKEDSHLDPALLKAQSKPSGLRSGNEG